MPTTLTLRDFLLRSLTNATPGTSDATDHLGRAIKAGNVDSMGRALQVLAFPTTTAVTLGARYSVSGKVLEVTVAGTTAGSAPTPPGNGATVVSGTATLRQITA